jgi:hypothetical protein
MKILPCISWQTSRASFQEKKITLAILFALCLSRSSSFLVSVKKIHASNLSLPCHANLSAFIARSDRRLSGRSHCIAIGVMHRIV